MFAASLKVTVPVGIADPEAALTVTERVTGPLPSAWNVTLLLFAPLMIVPFTMLHCTVV